MTNPVEYSIQHDDAIHQDPPTEVLAALARVLSHGWGRIEVIIRGGEVQVIHVTETYQQTS